MMITNLCKISNTYPIIFRGLRGLTRKKEQVSFATIEKQPSHEYELVEEHKNDLSRLESLPVRNSPDSGDKKSYRRNSSVNYTSKSNRRVEDEESSKTYRTFRQQVKHLKKQCSLAQVTVENQHEMVKNAVTMFHHLPYEEQLQLKEGKHQEFISKLQNFKDIRHQINTNSIIDIIPSPIKERYRNKDCMSVGLDVEGRLTVGFHVGGRSQGVVTVSPDNIDIIREDHKLVAAIYTNFLASIPRDHVSMYLGEQGWTGGNWSEIMIRSNYKDEIMINVGYFTNDGNNKDFEAEAENLINKMLASGLPIASIYIREIDKNGVKKSKLIYGSEFIIERIGNIQMSLGPETFCQGNSLVAEKLIEVVQNRISSGYDKTLLDLCCGSGMFGLQLSKYFRGVIGIDMEDTRYAMRNVKMNNITNCSYKTEKVQTLLPKLFNDLRVQGAAVSAVLNPGRSGIHHNVMVAIRRFPLLKSLVYVSCQPEDKRVVDNIKILLGPDRKDCPVKLRTTPFRLTSSGALDMFPHTHHCEHVLVFKR